MKKRVAIFVVALALTIVLLWANTDRANRGDFDEDTWAAMRGNSDHDNVRGEMLNDVLENVATPGRTRAYIHGRLGPPDEVRNLEWLYYVGIPWTSIDAHYVAVVFNDDDIVVDAHMTRD